MPRNPNKTPCSVPDCRAWAIRDSDPPRCSAHTPGKVGAPPGNRNNFTHGFYASTLHPDDLAGLDEGAIDTSLDEEIFLVRLALRRIQLMIVTGVTPGPVPNVLTSTTLHTASASPSRAPTPCPASSASATTCPATTASWNS